LPGEHYVMLIRCGEADHERIFHTRTGPHQRIKVSTNSRLSVLADSIVSLVPSVRHGPLHIILYVNKDQGRIQVPLCVSVTELFFMTNQSRESEVLYFIHLLISRRRERRGWIERHFRLLFAAAVCRCFLTHSGAISRLTVQVPLLIATTVNHGRSAGRSGVAFLRSHSLKWQFISHSDAWRRCLQ
jgi:hypothetical protein